MTNIEVHGYMIKAAACLAVVGMATFACMRTKSRVDTPLVCNNIKPLEWSKGDTLKTKEQIIIHNEVWDCYCDVEKAKERGINCDFDK